MLFEQQAAAPAVPVDPELEALLAFLRARASSRRGSPGPCLPAGRDSRQTSQQRQRTWQATDPLGTEATTELAGVQHARGRRPHGRREPDHRCPARTRRQGSGRAALSPSAPPPDPPSSGSRKQGNCSQIPIARRRRKRFVTGRHGSRLPATARDEKDYSLCKSRLSLLLFLPNSCFIQFLNQGNIYTHHESTIQLHSSK